MSPAPEQVYLRAQAARARSRRLGDAVLDGLALGLLDRAALQRLDEHFYATARERVDGAAVRYADAAHIRSGLQPWELAALRAGFPDGARVLVTSAGAGREVLGLMAAGYDPVGYEPNAALVAAGRSVLGETGDADRLRPTERDVFPAHGGELDGVVVGWGSYMLIQGRERRIELLRGARAHLRPGAPLLLSFFTRPATRYFAISAAVAAPLRRLRGAEPVESGDALSPNFVHYFEPEELRGEVAAAGFAVTRYEARPYAHALAEAR